LKENVIIGKLIPAGSGFGVVPGMPLSAVDEATLSGMVAAGADGATTVTMEEIEAATEDDLAELQAAGFVPASLGATESLMEADGDDAYVAALDVDEAPEGFSIETVEDGAVAEEE